MKQILILFSALFFMQNSNFATPYSREIISPDLNKQLEDCTMTAESFGHGSQTCGTETTYYTTTSTATATGSDCIEAYNIAKILATIKATNKMRELLLLLPPCTGPEPPTNP